MTLLHPSTPPAQQRQGSRQRLLDPQEGLSSLLVRKARSAHDLTAQVQRKLRTVVSELRFPDVRAGDKALQTSQTHRIDHISRLPEELLIAILCYLDGSSIGACNQTCHSLRLAISHSMQLQYELALFSCGMRDGPRRDANHAVQLGRLLAHDSAWQKLAWTDARPLEHLSGSFHPAAVSGSTIAFIPFGPGTVSGYRLLIQQFPSALRGTEMRHWELQFQLMSVHDTLMDVSQDLLILLEADALSNYTTIYHVYSLSTGRPHPLAANEGLLEMPEGRTISGAASGLCGDYIGATAYSLSDKSTNLVLWNWKTGERKVDAPLPTPVLGLRPTFTFLDPHHILVGFLWLSESQSQPRDLLVCALDPSRLKNTDDAPIENVSTYRFRIPKLLSRRDYWEIHTHRNSVPLHPSNSTTTSAPHYFDNDPEDQLVVIEMASRRRYPRPDKPDPALSVCIPARAILRRIVHARQPLVFAWEQWGEGHAFVERRVDIERRLPNLTRVCGLRQAARKPVPRPDGPAVFHVADFHPGRASRIAQSRAEGKGPPGGVDALAPLRAIVEVPLPAEMQSVDPVLISTSICQDALIAFERMDYGVGGVRRVFVCSF